MQRLLATIGIAALFVLTACGGGSNALGRDAAIAAARAAVPERETITGVISAKAGQFSDFDTHATGVISRADRRVWAMAFSGSFTGSCGPASATPDAHAACPPPAPTMLVIIGERDGEFIEARMPVDARPSRGGCSRTRGAAG